MDIPARAAVAESIRSAAAPGARRSGTDGRILQRRCVGDDNHSTDRLAAGRMGEFSVTLLTQTRTGLALALEVLNRVFERHAVTREERVQVVPRRNIQEPTHLHACQAVPSVRLGSKRFERCTGHVATRASEPFGKRVGHIKPDLSCLHDIGWQAATFPYERTPRAFNSSAVVCHSTPASSKSLSFDHMACPRCNESASTSTSFGSRRCIRRVASLRWR